MARDHLTIKTNVLRGSAHANENSRVPPVPPESWTEEQRLVIGDLRVNGRVLNISKPLANHPKLAKRWLVFANHIMGKSSLSLRDREILILRIGWPANPVTNGGSMC